MTATNLATVDDAKLKASEEAEGALIFAASALTNLGEQLSRPELPDVITWHRNRFTRAEALERLAETREQLEYVRRFLREHGKNCVRPNRRRIGG